ncbi:MULTISPECIES: ROK family protein [Actinosynnema]|uniref:ROK family protein n=1 Tax=Actinosynnema TaxID=40566 RepID=UPI0020A48D00|nr:ROK family protein [Actinosynnema pretiosum]MCP2094674.1 ROK family protein [Actinosynnema pretiosum]
MDGWHVRGAAVGIEVRVGEVVVSVRRHDEEHVVDGIGSPGVSHRGKAWIEIVDGQLGEVGMTASDVRSIGLCVQEAADPLRGRAWEEALAERFPHVPVVRGDADGFAAYGEHVHGAGGGARVLLSAHVSTGFGAGLVVGGTIFRSGALEALGSGPLGRPRLVERVHERYRGLRADLPARPVEVVWRAKEHDPACVQVLHEVGRALGAELARVRAVVDPDVIVLGGDLSFAPDALVRGPVREELERAASPGDRPVVVRKSRLADLAGARGALAFAAS